MDKMPNIIKNLTVSAVFFFFLVGPLLISGKSLAESGIIESGRPQYIIKNHKNWESKGRIVGIAKNAPDFEVTILTSSKEVYANTVSEKLEDGKKTYEVWLKPGVYILLVKAAGYETTDFHKLEVRAGHDLRIDFEFSER